MIPDLTARLAGIALGVDEDGRPRDTDPEARAAAADLLVRAGWATTAEIGRLSLRELRERIDDRLREQGIEPGLHA